MKEENQKKSFSQVFAELKLKLRELLLSDTDILDRLKIDYESRTMKEVLNWFKEDTGVKSRKLHNCKLEDRMPVKYLPNCSSYQGVNNENSWISRLFNTPKRVAKQGGVVISWMNNRRNQFLTYRFRYLGYRRDNHKDESYWRQALKLMRSDVYIIASMNHVLHGWEKDLSETEIKSIFNRVKEMTKENPVRVRYKRTYIPKSNGKLRPLGVPSRTWRIYLHMWNAMIVWWSSRFIDEEQHAYQPGKGTWTAWRSLISRIQEEEQIYEFDLSNFFGSVNLSYNYDLLLKEGMPKDIAEYLYRLNTTVVELGKESKDKLDESQHRRIIWNSDGTPNPNLVKEIRKSLSSSDPQVVSAMVLELQKRGYSLEQSVGVPQGAATSCGLSILNLDRLFQKLRKLIMYADDGVFFPQEDVPKITHMGSGIQEAKAKSGWIKRNSEWLKPIKFLGMEYVPPWVESLTGDKPRSYPWLRSNTREGTIIEYDSKRQFRVYLASEYENLYAKYVKYRETEDEQPLESIPMEGWITKKYEEFSQKSPETKLRTLFESREGSAMMSELYGKTKPSAREVFGDKFWYTRNSWCNLGWIPYIKRIVKMNVIDSILSRLMCWEKLSEGSLESLRDTIVSLLSNPIEEVEKEMNKILEGSTETLEEAGELQMRILNVIHLCESTSSSFAVDDILSHLEKNNGSLAEWSFERHPGVIRNRIKPSPLKRNSGKRQGEINLEIS